MSPFLRSMRMPSVCCCALLLAAGADSANAQALRGAQMAGGAPAADPVGHPQQGQLIAKATCAACHGLHGNAPSAQVPKLAGQNPAYLYQALRKFRTGARRSPVMGAAVAGMSDRDMADVASYYSLQRRRPDPPERAGPSAAGERIFLTGIPEHVPACVACHRSPARGRTPPMMGGMMGNMMRGRGMGTMGMMGGGRMTPATGGAVPTLAGQHARYLIQQLDRFADGKRPSPVMEPIAAGMDESQRTAVARYLSTLRPDTNEPKPDAQVHE